MARTLRRARLPVEQGPRWTIDAPFQETAAAIEGCRARGVLAVEMEAAALSPLHQMGRWWRADRQRFEYETRVIPLEIPDTVEEAR